MTCADSARALELPRRAGSRAAVAGSYRVGLAHIALCFCADLLENRFRLGTRFWETEGVSVSTVKESKTVQRVGLQVIRLLGCDALGAASVPVRLTTHDSRAAAASATRGPTCRLQ